MVWGIGLRRIRVSEERKLERIGVKDMKPGDLVQAVEPALPNGDTTFSGFPSRVISICAPFVVLERLVWYVIVW